MKAWCCIPIFLALAVSIPAQAPGGPEAPAGVTPANEGSALAIIEQRIAEYPPPVEPPRSPGLGLTIAGAACGLTSAGLAFYLTLDGSETSGGDQETFWTGIGCGAAHGLFLNSILAAGLFELLFRYPDLRAEYGNLLDLPERAREEQAYRILRRQAEAGKRRRLAITLLTFGVSVLPVGTYYLAGALYGTNAQVREFGGYYTIGLLLGSSLLLPLVAVKSAEEQTLERLEAARAAGGRP